MLWRVVKYCGGIWIIIGGLWFVVYGVMFVRDHTAYAPSTLRGGANRVTLHMGIWGL